VVLSAEKRQAYHLGDGAALTKGREAKATWVANWWCRLLEVASSASMA